MSGCFGDIRAAERPAFSRARHTFRGAVTLYETFVCSEMGSVCEMMPYAHIDPAILAPWWMFCVFYGTYWIVDLYHQHCKCMWLLLPRFVPRWMGNRSIGTRWW